MGSFAKINNKANKPDQTFQTTSITLNCAISSLPSYRLKIARVLASSQENANIDCFASRIVSQFHLIF